MFKKILVPLDTSAFSEHAIPYAKEIAHRFGANIHFCYVTLPAPDPASTSEVDLSSLVPSRVIEEEKRYGEAYLKRKAEELKAKGISTTYEVRGGVGGTAFQILEAAKATGVDLIVMNSRGRTGIPRALLGSVANQVMGQSTIPVLVIRA